MGVTLLCIGFGNIGKFVPATKVLRDGNVFRRRINFIRARIFSIFMILVSGIFLMHCFAVHRVHGASAIIRGMRYN